VILSAANANDATMLEAVLDDIPAIRMPTGRRRRRPGKVHADKAYDHAVADAPCADAGSDRGSPAAWSTPRTGSAATAGRLSAPGAWLGGFRRLRIRYERSSERFYALAMLACSVICFRSLKRPP